MVSLFLFFVWLLCLCLILVWPTPEVPPLNRQYRTSEEDPAWHRFTRLRRWYYIWIGALSITAFVVIQFAVSLN